MSDKQAILADLVAMSRAIAVPEANHVIQGEGNTSATIDEQAFYVKGSGEQLSTITEAGFVEVSFERALGLMDSPPLEGTALRDALLATKVNPDAPGRPSVEVLMHAVALKYGGAKVIGHTHTVVVNQLMCSTRAEEFTHMRLFPDHIVLCGADSAYVPYVDPGIPLGRAIYEAIEAFKAQYNVPPKTIMMKNHGVVVLGQSALEVRQILDMTTKAALIYQGACAVGGPVPMPPEEVDRIYNREDEHYRRAKIMGA